MFDKLDPPPSQGEPSYGWEELRRIINANFSDPGVDQKTLKLPIDLSYYDLDKQEMMDEIRSVGYKVSYDSGLNRLIVELRS